VRVTITNSTGSKTINAKVSGSGLVKFQEGNDYFIDHISAPKWLGWTIKKKPFKWREFLRLWKKN
tara:strand:+ start:12394 stop:12588 length:195 start_codon:yes stop_codon:yes gene_type:complete